ncbi:hypothetical protein TRFO_02579 [Tritrichomonas foetus]|uniref:Right handed beta helix domain-containing protein n=1 Tax=Tritrichomonas foetus TaxID=1144522 RepID=A0A1J4L375_9EUKA|nr:hypothetical protein TRFO_02579 [Tritrichomonas foetus]|eukprot:OHT17528.1 hypothetical protein TRFO_02579 [Tritrichomonas foetus]
MTNIPPPLFSGKSTVIPPPLSGAGPLAVPPPIGGPPMEKRLSFSGASFGSNIPPPLNTTKPEDGRRFSLGVTQIQQVVKTQIVETKSETQVQTLLAVDQQVINDSTGFSLRALPNITYELQPIDVIPEYQGCIQETIDKANDGATIQIPEGEYDECLKITKSIKLIGKGPVTIRSGETTDTITSSGASVTIEGISIVQNKSKARGAVRVSQGSLNLVKCHVSSGISATIQLLGSGCVFLNECTIEGGNDVAIKARYETQVVAEKTTISACQRCGVTIKDQAIGKFDNCTFTNLGQNAIVCVDKAHILVNDCRFTDCMLSVTSKGEKLLVESSVFERSNHGCSLAVTRVTSLVLTKNTFRNCSVDIRENSNVDLSDNSFEGSSLILYDSANAQTKGESFSGAAEAAVVCHTSSQITLKNIKVRDISGVGFLTYSNSKVVLERAFISSTGGSAVVCHSNAEVQLFDCDIQKTKAAAIVCHQSALAATRLNIRNCERGGVQLFGTTNATLKDCKLDGNSGCGIVASTSVFTLENCTVSENTYAAIHLASSCNLTLNGGSVKSNGKGGVFALNSSKASLENVQMSGNKWAAVYVDSSSEVSCAKSTFSENQQAVVVAGTAKLTECTLQNEKVACQVNGLLEIVDSTLQRNDLSVAGVENGKIVARGSKFNDNRTHINVSTGATITAESCDFSKSTGKVAVIVNEGSNGILTECNFTDNKNCAFSTVGYVNVRKCKFINTENIGVLCGTNCSGEITDNEFEQNGQCAVQIVGGTPAVTCNKIQNHAKFGIYMIEAVPATITGNEFHKNRMANIWKS